VSQCVTVCHSVLQCVECIAVCCSTSGPPFPRFLGSARTPASPVHMCCSVLQCVAVCYSVVQCLAVCCIGSRSFCTYPSKSYQHMLQCVAVCCSVLQCVAVCCTVLQCVLQCGSVSCRVLYCVALCCTVLQCVALSLGNSARTLPSLVKIGMHHVIGRDESCHTQELVI